MYFKQIIRCPFQSMAVAEAELNAAVCLTPKQPKNSVAVCAFHLGTLKHAVLLQKLNFPKICTPYLQGDSA